MTYQFDPKPDGLHYQPFSVNFSKITMWYLRDAAPVPWIDLRSVFKAMGMSWDSKWRMYCVAMRVRWQLEPCVDNKLRETLLAPANKIPAILADVYEHIKDRHYSAAAQVQRLRAVWREKYKQIETDAPAVEKLMESAAHAPKAKGRKVSPYVVRQIYLLLNKGNKKPAIAKVLDVSLGVVQQVAAGTYKLDQESMDAWWATFGAESGHGMAFEGSKSAAKTLSR